MSCQRCDGIEPEQVERLTVIGGSHAPYSDPHGELWRCPDCGAWFCYTFDHDNEIGYQAAPKTLVRLEPAAVRRFARECEVHAQGLYDYFKEQSGDYKQRAARDYAEQLVRLRAALEELG